MLLLLLSSATVSLILSNRGATDDCDSLREDIEVAGCILLVVMLVLFSSSCAVELDETLRGDGDGFVVEVVAGSDRGLRNDG